MKVLYGELNNNEIPEGEALSIPRDVKTTDTKILYGEINNKLKPVEYTGLDTDTAETVVDNTEKTISVNVKTEVFPTKDTAAGSLTADSTANDTIHIQLESISGEVLSDETVTILRDTRHNSLTERNAGDAHPISSITNLQSELDDKQDILPVGTAGSVIINKGSGLETQSGYGYDISAATINIPWDGSTEGKEAVPYFECYKVSTNTPTLQDLDEGVLTYDLAGVQYTRTLDASATGDIWTLDEFIQETGVTLVSGDTSNVYLIRIEEGAQYVTVYDAVLLSSDTKTIVLSSGGTQSTLSLTPGSFFLKSVRYNPTFITRKLEYTTAARTQQIDSRFIPHDNTKLDKVSTANKVYGTDASGNQTTYDKDSFGQVDDVTQNGISIVENKIAKIILETGLGSDSSNSATVTAIRAFVNSSIEAVAAYYITATVGGDAFATKAAIDAGPWYYAGALRTPTRNDYAIVIADETHEGKTARYTYVKADGATTGHWDFQYTFNMSFTQAQLDAINSGINSAKVALYDAHLINTNNPHSVTKAQVGLGNVDNKSEATIKSDFTGSIASGNTGFVTGGDAYTALAGKQNTIDAQHKLSADLVDDTSTTNKFVTAAEKTSWNSKSTVSVSATGTATQKANYMTVDGAEWKVGGMDEVLDTDVKLSTQLKTYYNIGKITTASGTNPVVIGNAGDSIRKVLNNLTQMDEIQPSITANPSISALSFSSSASDEWGTQITTVNYSLSTNQGSYTYQPSPTGVTWSNFAFSGGCADVDKTTTSGTLTLTNTYTVGTSSAVSFTCVGTHSAGGIAKTNLGNDSDPIIQIQAGTKSRSANFSKSSVQYPYYLMSNNETITTVGSSGRTKSTLSACTSSGVSITASENTYVYFLLPASYSQSKIQYEALGQWYDWSAGTASAQTITITLNSGASRADYKAYRMNSKMAVGTTKFRIVNA